MRYDTLYVEGPGDIVAAFDSWREGMEHASETSVTYSSQLFAYCRERGHSLLAISYCQRRAAASADNIRAANMPRRMLRLPKVGYHLSLLWYALRIFAQAIRYRPRLILLTSGVVSWTAARTLGLTGATVVPILHNALWPEGFRPARPRDAWWWRSNMPPVSLAVSPAIVRQIASINPGAGMRLIDFRPTFAKSQFPRTHRKDPTTRPFRIVFAGRLEIEKGVLDIIEIAAALQKADPGAFHFEICGQGSQLDAVAASISKRDLQSVVTTWGRLDRVQLLQQYSNAHVCIVPTRSSFAEGYAQVVAESILLLRPVLTSPVVPASELFANACVLAKTDDVASYVAALRALAGDPSEYDRRVDACIEFRTTILDDGMSFRAALRKLDVCLGEKS